MTLPRLRRGLVLTRAGGRIMNWGLKRAGGPMIGTSTATNPQTSPRIRLRLAAPKLNPELLAAIGLIVVSTAATMGYVWALCPLELRRTRRITGTGRVISTGVTTVRARWWPGSSARVANSSGPSVWNSRAVSPPRCACPRRCATQPRSPPGTSSPRASFARRGSGCGLWRSRRCLPVVRRRGDHDDRPAVSGVLVVGARLRLEGARERAAGMVDLCERGDRPRYPGEVLNDDLAGRSGRLPALPSARGIPPRGRLADVRRCAGGVAPHPGLERPARLGVVPACLRPDRRVAAAGFGGWGRAVPGRPGGDDVRAVARRVPGGGVAIPARA